MIKRRRKRIHASQQADLPYPVELPRFGKVLSRMSIQSKFLVMLLAISILSVAVVGFIGFESGRLSMRAAAYDRLTEIRQSQERQLGAQFSQLESSIVIFSQGSSAANAIDAFTAGFDALNAPGAPAIDPAQDQALTDYYRDVFAPTEDRKTGTRLDVPNLLPRSNAQRYLQVHYTIPFADRNQAAEVDNAGDDSAWSAANARFNPFFRALTKRFAFDDALLIDPDGNVVYTTYKGVDLGTNILTGPYRGGELSDAFSKAIRSNAQDYVGLTDFGDYQPAGEPTAWIVTPISRDGRVAGVLALQFPIGWVNRVMTFGRDWERAGMGATGETILVGPDNLMRSDSRLFLTDPQAYKRDVVAAGTAPEVADSAIRHGTTALIQPVDTEATALARQGRAGTLIAEDYLGRKTLQAYTPFTMGELHWSLIAKINVAEAFAPVAKFTRTLVLSTTAIIFAVCLAAMLLSRRFTRPIRQLEGAARRIASGDYGVMSPVRSLDEFGDLTVAFNEMSHKLAVKERQLEEQRQENDRLLLSLMPEPVVRRYRDGEENIALDHQNVAVIFADVAGLDELTAGLLSDESAAIVNRLVRQFDSAAENLGIERVRTVHNGYLASCGLNVPRLDNIRRTVDFAIEMDHILARFNAETGHELRLRAGIDTGAVTSGLIGKSGLAYDVWGSAVYLAHRARAGSAQPGVYVTSRVYDAMRDIREFSAEGVVATVRGDEPIYRLTEDRR